MNGKFNKPHLMGNCARCYYATRKSGDGSCICARFPDWVNIPDMNNHFCGEFAWIDNDMWKPLIER